MKKVIIGFIAITAIIAIAYNILQAKRQAGELDFYQLLNYNSAQQNMDSPSENNNGLSNNKFDQAFGLESDKSNAQLSFPGILPEEKITGKKVLITTNKGDIEIELFADKAPKTVSNFVYLVENGFYNNLTFHRVVPDFVIQGGDPNGNGTGGPGYSFPDEPVVGEYTEGTVAMANAGPNTNGSQFFICLSDLQTLPKQYNLFGKITNGMNVVHSIAIGDRINSATVLNK
ncbi:MAG: putative peptidyl-prolyl cis-trans isomerase [bacterium ADurb.Bin400]|nr:MAG: putative peptidyl-prolyl cis-trans isomerase [bacterium ADurb.Bin400]